MYAKVKKSLPEMYAFTVCMWLRSSAAPGVGTPFSYAVPGQANELVLIEWGNNPMEILINDKVGPCPAGRAGTAEPGPLGPGPGRLLGQVVTPPHPPSALALLLDVEDHRGSGCTGALRGASQVRPALGGGWSPGAGSFLPRGNPLHRPSSGCQRSRGPVLELVPVASV